MVNYVYTAPAYTPWCTAHDMSTAQCVSEWHDPDTVIVPQYADKIVWTHTGTPVSAPSTFTLTGTTPKPEPEPEIGLWHLPGP